MTTHSAPRTPQQPPWRDQAPVFPRAQFETDVRRSGRSHTDLARAARIRSPEVIGWWGSGTVQQPRGAGLRRVLEALGVPLDPYLPYLHAHGPSANLECPSCRRQWTVPQGAFNQIRARYRRMRRPLRASPKGRHLVECRRCSYRRRAPEMIKRLQGGLTIRRLGEEEAAKRGNTRATEEEITQLGKRAMKSLRIRAEAGDHAAREKLRRAIRPGSHVKTNPKVLAASRRYWKSAVHGQRVSAGKIMSVPLGLPLRRCELCTLLVHHRRFHRTCFDAFMRWRGRRSVSSEDRPPVSGDPRGRKVTAEILARNYGWLMAREISRDRSGNVATRASLYRNGTRTTVNEAVRSFLALLPGAWDLVFWPRPKSRANETRQRVVPLPAVLQDLIDSGGRDDLIRRLHGFGMPDGDIARITGASLERVRGVLAGATTTASA